MLHVAAARLCAAQRVLWHNPGCSKSRAALALLQATAPGTFTIRPYLDEPPTLQELQVR